MKRIFLVACLSCCTSCEKRIVPDEIEKKIDMVNLTLKGRDEQNLIKALVREINAITDNNSRIACFNLWVDRLIALDISEVDYHHQTNAIFDMWELINNDISDGLVRAGRTIEDAWEAKIQVLGWHRKQLERLKPVNPLPDGLKWNGKSIEVLNLKVEKAYTEWLCCYKSSARGYENHIRHLEGHKFLIDTVHSSAEQKERLRKKLRDFLGRSIRNEEELLRDFKNRKAMEFPYENIPRDKGPAEFRMPK